MKWLFTDYDGTLNVHHNDILDIKDLEFIKKWKQDGNKFCIASGRMDHELVSIIKNNNIECDYIIANNGACLYNKEDKLVENLTIPLEVRGQIFDILKTFKSRFYMSYCLENKRVDLSRGVSSEVDSKRDVFIYAPNSDNWEQGEKDILNSKILNLIYFYIDEKDVEEIKKAFSNIKGIKIISTLHNVLEIMNEKVSKAYGIKELADKFGFSSDDVYTFGDAENDIEMLEYTKHSFAMSKAKDEVKSKASYVVSNIHEAESIIDSNK